MRRRYSAESFRLRFAAFPFNPLETTPNVSGTPGSQPARLKEHSTRASTSPALMALPRDSDWMAQGLCSIDTPKVCSPART